MEPKVREARDDLAGLRGRLAGSDLPDPTHIEAQLREQFQPRLEKTPAVKPTRKTRRSIASDRSRVRIPEPKVERSPSPPKSGSGRPSPGRPSPWRRRIAVVLIVAATLALAGAYAQVRIARQVKTATVILAVDVSRSMDETDVAPNRLSAAVAAARAFLDRLPVGFRVGLVTFADRSALVVAPTSDRSRLSAALGTLATPTVHGTVIGDGLSAAVQAVQADRGSSGDLPAAVVLLTDGQDSGSVTAPDQAAKSAENLRIPVFTVAIGEASAVGSVAGDPSVATGADLLGQIANSTGAKAFTTSSADQLTQVYSSLGSRLSYDLAIGSNAGPLVILAVLLTLAAAALGLLGHRDPYDELASPRPRRR